MLFTLEALNASEGDCLLLSYGSSKRPKFVLIDGGPSKTYNDSLLPRVVELRKKLRLKSGAPLPIELLVVTHVDDDHITGVLKLTQDLRDALETKKPPLVQLNELWHNSFDDVLGGDEIEKAIDYLSKLPTAPTAGAARRAVSSVKQGRELRDAAALLRIAVNAGFKGLIARPDDAGIDVQCGDGLTLTVISPTRAELERYKAKWDAGLAAPGANRGKVAAAQLDTKAFNLVSIAVLAEMGGKTMLLTGDARGDHLLAGLEAAGKLAPGGSMTVDVLKLPHHGSAANVTLELLRRVIADTYVVSANGTDNNPDSETLARLSQARGDAPYTLLCTFPEEAYKLVKSGAAGPSERKKALLAFDAWTKSPEAANVTVVYRDPKAYSVCAALGDETLD